MELLVIDRIRAFFVAESDKFNSRGLSRFGETHGIVRSQVPTLKASNEHVIRIRRFQRRKNPAELTCVFGETPQTQAIECVAFSDKQDGIKV